MRAIRSIVVVTLLAIYSASPAHANGRFPKAQAIATAPGSDGSALVLRATFGLLLSRDAGKSFHWLCQQAFGFSSTWDPPIALTRDGRIWVALSDGLRVTRDGCEVTEITELHGQLVADLTTDARGERVFAIASTPRERAFVWRSAGVRFERLGSGVADIQFDTVEVAPSLPSRLYLTGVPMLNGPRAHLFRSDDGGATLREMHVALPRDGRLFVSAIDPKDPNRVFCRLLHDRGSDLLLSEDGGQTFRVALHMTGAMFGLARSDDGDAVYAGSGDPAEGVWRSLDRGQSWEAAAKGSIFCLHATGDRVFACSNPYVPRGYAIAVSRDRGASFIPLGTFDNVGGPVACDAGSGTRCEAAWPETRAMIATSAQLQPPPGPLDASLDADSDGAVASPSAPSRRGARCACRAPGVDARDAPAGASIAWVVLAMALYFIRRRAW